MTPLHRPELLALAVPAGAHDAGTAACGGEGGPAQTAASAPGGLARVTGTVAYRERIALAPTAEARVALVVLSRQDAPSTTLADVTIETGGAQVPIPFELPYDPAAIDERDTHAVRATIVDGERVLFRSTEVVRVITRGAPTTDVALLLTRASG